MQDRIRIVLFIIIMLFSSFTWGLEKIEFTRLGVNDGLSDNQINYITQDSKGFIWISTSYGLNRYDGYSVKTFTKEKNNPHSLPDNFVETVQEDAEDGLWIYVGRQKYIYYDQQKETFQPAMPLIKNKYGMTKEPSIMYIDKHKDLWMYADYGLYHYNIQKKQLTFCPLKKINHSEGIILTCISEDNKGILLVYSNGSFEQIDRETNKIIYSNNELSEMAESQLGRHLIFVDSDNDYWIYCSKGVWVYCAQKKEWVHLSSEKKSIFKLSGDHIKDIKEDTEGKIWIAVDNGGINLIDKKKHSINYIKNDLNDERSLAQNSISCLYCDVNGGMWAGSNKRGISHYNRSAFKIYTDYLRDLYSNNNFTTDVNAIIEDRKKNLWIGTSNGLVFINEDKSVKKLYQHTSDPYSLRGNVVVSLLEDKKGRIWIGTYQNGLCMFDGNKFISFKDEFLQLYPTFNNNVWALAEGQNGRIWIGTLGDGLFSIDPNSWHIYKHCTSESGFEHECINSIRINQEGNVYMGTSYGIACYYPATGAFIKKISNNKGTQEFINPTINDIYEDSRGLLWLATPEGINIYNSRTDEIINPINSNDIKNEIVQAIIEDENKNIWITTTKSIFNIIVNIEPSSDNYIYNYHKYDGLDGFHNQQFNARSITKKMDGEILCGGTQGLSMFYPNKIKYNRFVPKVKLTALYLFNQEIKIDSIYNKHKILTCALPYTSEIEFKHSQNVFSIAFSSMDYVLPQKNTYLYMLKGFDSEWRKTNTNKITYTNLNPGVYTLNIKAINNDGFTSTEKTELKIIITPPFWTSTVGYIIYGFVFIFILFLSYKFIRHNESQKYKLIQIRQEAQQRHEMDDMKLRFFTNISHELRTPLTLIISPLEFVIKHMEDNKLKEKLEIAYHNAIQLLNMINQLLDFRKCDIKGHQLNLTQGDIIEFIHNICNNFSECSERKNIFLTFFSSTNSLWMDFDEDKINKIVTNILSNAFKFTPKGGRIDVSLDIIKRGEEKQEFLEIKIADNGIGINNEDKKHIFERFYQASHQKGLNTSGSGIGLHIVKEFVTLHHGTITVCDNIGKGSVFIVTIPINRAQDSFISVKKDIIETSVYNKTEIKEYSDNKTAEEHNELNDKIRPTILIVDDNDDFRVFMKDFLSSEYNILEASDGKQAWEMIPNLQPDIIVCDIMMPEMNGNELCKLVKSDIRTSHILFILLTARSAKEHELEGFKNGADEYITKPFNLEILALRIKNLLQRRKENYKHYIDVSPSKISITSLDEKLIKKAIQYVEDNISRDDLSVEELSGELGMSRVHLYKKLLAITGKTPREFIRIMRLKRASQLLEESQLNVSEIAFQTGFNNMRLFRKYFKDEFGTLPSEYKENSKNAKK